MTSPTGCQTIYYVEEFKISNLDSVELVAIDARLAAAQHKLFEI